MKISVIILSISCLFLVSCQKKELSDTKLQVWFYQEIPVSSLNISVNIGVDNKNLFSNSQIISTTSIIKIEATIDSIKNVPLIQSATPRGMYFRLKNLKSGIHPFIIRINNKTRFDGELIITDNYIEVKKEEADNLEFIQKKVMRLPENLIWGWYSYKQLEYLDLNKSIDELFFQNDCDEITLQTGNFSQYFETDNNGKIEIEHYNPNNYYFKNFQYYFDGDISKLNEPMNKFINTYNSNNQNNTLNIWYRASNGKSFIKSE